jgi:DNA-binding NtrC family response regulator
VDIAALARIFLDKLNRFNSKEIHDIDPEVLAAFEKYSWPGNIRELENLIERAFILETSSVLSPDSFPQELFSYKDQKSPLAIDTSLALAESRRKVIEQFEKSYLENLLAIKKGSIKDVAGAAGITPRQISKMMKRYGLKKEMFKAPPARTLGGHNG